MSITPERIEEIKPYFTNEQLDELSREYRTMPTDGEGYAIEPEYEGMVARGNIVKLVSDVKTVRAALEESQQQRDIAQANYKTYYAEATEVSERLAEAQQTIARYREALEFYALDDTYRAVFNPPTLNNHGYTTFAPIVEDEGKRAQAALANKEGSDKA